MLLSAPRTIVFAVPALSAVDRFELPLSLVWSKLKLLGKMDCLALPSPCDDSAHATTTLLQVLTATLVAL